MSSPEGAEDEEGLTGDFVGTVSARLLGAGIPRHERLGALRLLGALVEVGAGTDLSTVTGVVHNAADQPLAVTGFTLFPDIAGQQVTSPATEVPVIVPATGAATWQATVPVAATAGITVRVVLDHWEWRGAAAACPTT